MLLNIICGKTRTDIAEDGGRFWILVDSIRYQATYHLGLRVKREKESSREHV